MYGGRYGIWGIDPYGPNPMDRAISVAQGLGAIQQTGLQNQGLGLANQYAPENQAISLADSLTRAQNLDWQKQRFGDSYSMSKMYGMLPTPLKLQFAIDNPELVSQAVQGTFQNGNYQQAKNTPNYAMSVLQPYLAGNQGIGAMQNQQNSQPQQPSGMGSYQPPAPAQQPKGATGIGNVPDNSGSQSADSADSADNATPATNANNSNTANAFKNTADDALQKNLRTADQIKREDAGRRAEIAIEKANKNIPLLSAYSGITGRMKFAQDAASSALGYTTPEYQAYKDMVGINEMLKGDLGVALGKRSTDQAAQELGKIVDISSISSNPAAFMKNWYSNMDTIKKTIASNKLTTAKIIKKNDIDVTKPPETGWNGDVYSDGKGNFYNLADVQKAAKGGK